MMTIISGIGGILTSMFGGHNANIAGPMTAICSSEEAGEDKEKRYAASVLNGIIFGLFGVFASLALAFVKGLPGALVGIVAGLAMINVLYGAFHIGFGTNKFRLGSFFALCIALSGVTLFKISSPFWAPCWRCCHILPGRKSGFLSQGRNRGRTGSRVKIVNQEFGLAKLLLL